MVLHGNIHKATALTGAKPNNLFSIKSIKKLKMIDIQVATMADLTAKGVVPDIRFWVGCMGSYDERAQKITKNICKILQHVGLKYAILGEEETCTGDPAKRGGK